VLSQRGARSVVPPRERPDGPPVRRGPVLAGLMMAMALAAMDTTIVSTAVPQIVGNIGGFSMVGWLFSIYLLTQTVTMPVYGKLADVYGRRPVLMFGMVVFLVGSALCAGAGSMVWLVVFRAVQGLGAGALQAVVQTVAGDLYSLKERGRVQGLLSSVWAVAAVTGPTLGGLFADYVNWRWIFLINLPIGAVALFLIGRFLREAPRPRRRPQLDVPGCLLVLATCGLLVFALVQGGTAWSWLSGPSLVCFALVPLLAGLTVVVERRAAEPVVPGWVWRSPVLAGANLTYVALGLLVIGPSAYLPTYAQTSLGLGAVAAGFVLASMSLSWPLASALSDRLYLRIGFRDTALIGVLLALAAVGGFVVLGEAGTVWTAVVSTVVLGAGLGLISTSMVVGVQSTVDHDRRGVATASLMSSRFLGQSVGAAVFGAVVNGTLQHRLDTAPAAVADALPSSVDSVATAVQSGEVTGAELAYLRSAIDASTGHLYLGLVAVAVVAVLVLLRTPRRFPVRKVPDRAETLPA
jgi:EmrB/QacA subfamily drug resistance transporter